MRPAVAAIGLICALALPPFAQAQDPAYVDGAKLPDPARVDGLVGARGSAQPPAHDEDIAREQAAQVAETQRQIQEQTARFIAAQNAAHQAAMPQAPDGPPVGGHDMLAAFGRTRGNDGSGGYGAGVPTASGASIPRQIGSGLLQDAAGVVDSRVQREIYGRNGTVIFPSRPQDQADSPPSGW